ncbi:MAG TPA: HEAT repeat domain-containing protein, partial [Candidatus Limnocylindria bacterium]|nr:HEAT repeat domain-containing protein [Candidatus Limnocylindria bacterium]
TGFPRLDVDYSWDERAKLAKLTIRQTQPVSETVPLFNFPLPIRFKSKSGVVDRVLTVKEKAENFYVTLEAQPELLRIDPNVSVLSQINFRPTEPMLAAQLADKSDTIGRYIAVEQLGAKRDHASIGKLKNALNSDEFYAVRIAAARALRMVHTDEAFDALVASTKQSDARVRKEVIADVLAFYRPAAFEYAQVVLKMEKNPDIVGAAISALAPTGTNARPTLVYYLNTNSWRQHLTETAMTAMRSQNDPFYVQPLRDALQKRKQEFTGRTTSVALDALAVLARDLENKDDERELIASFANDNRRIVKLAAINALGTLRDERAVPILERFASAQKNAPERTAAERSIEAIRATRKNTLEMGDVRREVLELQKQNRELRKDFDALKKKLDAGTPGKPAKK